MGAHSAKELTAHIGHQIHCVQYGEGMNVAVECEDCGTILLDFDAVPTEEHAAYILGAMDKVRDDDDIDVTSDARVSTSDEGAYVEAWIWVPK